jgi:hypothetical protein
MVYTYHALNQMASAFITGQGPWGGLWTYLISLHGACLGIQAALDGSPSQQAQHTPQMHFGRGLHACRRIRGAWQAGRQAAFWGRGAVPGSGTGSQLEP